jgi:hypothetical protein
MKEGEIKEMKTKSIMSRKVEGGIRGRRKDKISGRSLTRRWRWNKIAVA